MITSPPKPRNAARFAAATSEAPPQARELRPGWAALPGGVVDGGEIIVLAIKPSMWRPLFDSAPWMVTCCLLAIILTWLRTPIAGFSLFGTAQMLLLLASARLGLAVVRWIPTWHVLTNRRIIDVKGIRTPRISACLLVDVRNTYLRVLSADKLARLGTITFVTTQTDRVSHVWQSIAHPEEVHAKIRRAIEGAIDQQGPRP